LESVLAVDLGGTSLRVARIGVSGAVLALAIRPHAIGEEADAEAWWITLADATAEIGTIGVRGICIGGFTRSQVLVDAATRPVRPAQCFPDGRGVPVEGAAEDTWLAMTAFHPVARLAWVARHDPTALARARHVLQPAEFLAARLTGRPASDRIANSWAIERDTGTVTTAPLRRADLEPELLPELLPPGTLLGPAHGVPGLDGVPVFMGSMDTWVATIGIGVGSPGDAYLITGTTDAGGVLTAEPAPRPGLVTLPWGDGVFHTGGPSAAGGACLAWAARLLGLPDAAAVVALAAPATARPPLLFLPALVGTRAPHWQPGARGALIGLDAGHGREDIARAVLEGIACADRDLHGGLPCTRVVVAGGGASDRACQIRADVLGQPVWRVAGEPGLAGAAILAWTGLGAYRDIGAAQVAMVRPDRMFAPGTGFGYEALYAAYQRAEGAMTILAEPV
jgi:xylulokinase